MKRQGAVSCFAAAFILSIFGIGAEWSYSGESGPDFWGQLYPKCANPRQSPVEIYHQLAEPNENLTSFKFFGYKDITTLDNLTVWNDGYTVTVRVHGNLNIEGGGLEGRYNLKHFHFHWASSDLNGAEHRLDGVDFPLEMHLVHQAVKYDKISQALEDPKGLAVLGVFAKIGKPHPFFQAIIDNLRLLDIGDYANVRPFPLKGLLPDDTETYYRYYGSLTTPPCSESVVWTVFEEPMEISEYQIEQLRRLAVISNVTENFRPLQGLNGRQIFVRKKSDNSADFTEFDPPYSNSQNGTFGNPEDGATSIHISVGLLLVSTLLFLVQW